MGREGEVVAELLPEFERENPGIRVRVQQIPWTAAHEKLITAHVGGSTPDLSQLGNPWVPEFAAIRALEPLERRLRESSEIDSSVFFPGILETNRVQDHLFGVPWYVDTRVLFYRRDLLAEAGFDSIPRSWDEWRTAMVALKQVVGPERYPIFLPINEWTVPVVLGLQAGSTLLDSDATHGAFAGAEFRRAYRFYLGLFADRLAPPVANTEIANLYQEFARGYVCMYVTGPWNLGEFRRRLPPELQDAWTTSALPGPTGRESGLSLAGGSSLVVYAHSPHQDEAWRLVEFLLRPEQQVAFWELTGDLPAHRAAWNDSALARDPEMHAFREQLERAVPTPKVPEWEQIAVKLQERTELAARLAAPAESVLALLDADVDHLLEKRRWLIEHGRELETAALVRDRSGERP
jgi:multiple sugar transport system substrate-binding protein